MITGGHAGLPTQIGSSGRAVDFGPTNEAQGLGGRGLERQDYSFGWHWCVVQRCTPSEGMTTVSTRGWINLVRWPMKLPGCERSDCLSPEPTPLLAYRRGSIWELLLDRPAQTGVLSG